MNNTEFKLAVIEAIDKTVAQGQLGKHLNADTCSYTLTTVDHREIC